MLLNTMARALRDAGCVVEEAPGWIGHNHGSMNSVSAIIIHHTAGSATGDYPSYNVVRNGRTGLPGPLAQLGVGRSGKVFVFSNGLAYQAGATLQTWMNNSNSIGIEVESVGTGPVWPEVQVHATARATAALCKEYGVPVSRVLGHKEVCYPAGRKVDPVGIPGDMPAFRALVQQYINNSFDEPVDENQEEDDMSVAFVRGDSTVEDPRGVPYGYRVYKVEFCHDGPEIGVRTRVTSDQDPNYKLWKNVLKRPVQVMAQADLDRIPMKPGTVDPA